MCFYPYNQPFHYWQIHFDQIGSNAYQLLENYWILIDYFNQFVNHHLPHPYQIIDICMETEYLLNFTLFVYNLSALVYILNKPCFFEMRYFFEIVSIFHRSFLSNIIQLIS